MNYSQYGNLGMNTLNNMNSINPMGPQMGQPNQMGEGFRNVFGVVGGLQSLLHIFTSILDLLYFVKAFKTLFIDFLIKIIKKLLGLIKYLVTFRWMINLISKSNSVYEKIIYNSKYFKNFSIIFKLTLVFGIILCMILKYWKTKQLKELDKEEEVVNKDNIQIDKNESKKIEKEQKSNGNNTEHINTNTNIKESEERWKYIPK